MSQPQTNIQPRIITVVVGVIGFAIYRVNVPPDAFPKHHHRFVIPAGWQSSVEEYSSVHRSGEFAPLEETPAARNDLTQMNDLIESMRFV